jgi:hypothetical protein
VARPKIVLVSRLGFTDGLRAGAEREQDIRLVELEELVQD